MAEPQPSKLVMRFRLPSPALMAKRQVGSGFPNLALLSFSRSKSAVVPLACH
jgi:hypothetical protein